MINYVCDSCTKKIEKEYYVLHAQVNGEKLQFCSVACLNKNIQEFQNSVKCKFQVIINETELWEGKEEKNET